MQKIQRFHSVDGVQNADVADRHGIDGSATGATFHLTTTMHPTMLLHCVCTDQYPSRPGVVGILRQVHPLL